MDKKIILHILIVACVMFLYTPLQAQTKKVAGLKNGWYFITDIKTDAIDKTPILTVSDFKYLRLESDDMEIWGEVKTDKVKVWADATEKAIGKHIGFLYNGRLISKPQVNMRIEGGRFNIIESEMTKKEGTMREIYENLMKEMTPQN